MWALESVPGRGEGGSGTRVEAVKEAAGQGGWFRYVPIVVVRVRVRVGLGLGLG